MSGVRTKAHRPICSLILTALQLQRAVLCVQWETAEVHRAKRRHGDPKTQLTVKEKPT